MVRLHALKGSLTDVLTTAGAARGLRQVPSTGWQLTTGRRVQWVDIRARAQLLFFSANPTYGIRLCLSSEMVPICALTLSPSKVSLILHTWCAFWLPSDMQADFLPASQSDAE